MGKKEIPCCIYCKRKLTYTWPAHMRDSDPDLWPPTRGRSGGGSMTPRDALLDTLAGLALLMLIYAGMAL